MAAAAAAAAAEHSGPPPQAPNSVAEDLATPPPQQQPPSEAKDSTESPEQQEAPQSPHDESAPPCPGWSPAASIYHLSNYTIGSKEPRLDKYRNSRARNLHFAEQYLKWGMRRTVEGLLLTHMHGHPHVFIMELKNNKFFKLPGGRLRQGEDELEGLCRKLNNKLAPPDAPIDWKIGELVCRFWKPSFDGNTYPYLPPHITLPKERREVYLVHLPEHLALSVPSNYSLQAVPLFDLHENSQLYGSLIAHLPANLSRYRISCV